MDFQYVAYTASRKLVKGKLSAENESAAAEMLNYSGFRVVNLKPATSFVDMGKVSAAFAAQVKPKDIVMLSRQLALLLEAGTDVLTSLELLQEQITHRTLKPIIGQIAADLRNGAPLSTALSKHPAIFSKVYHRAIAAGEQSGNLEIVLRQMADYIERAALTIKKIKAALTYPIIVLVIGFGVSALMMVYIPAHICLEGLCQYISRVRCVHSDVMLKAVFADISH